MLIKAVKENKLARLIKRGWRIFITVADLMRF